MTDALRVLVVGEDAFPFHEFSDAAPTFEAVLSDVGSVETTTNRSALANLDAYDVLVDYLTDSTLTDAQLDGLRSFVADGGGYVPVHCAADLTSTAAADPDELIDPRDEPVPELRDLIGGHFLDHPEQAAFGVDVVADHPVVDGVDDFRVFDEPYQVEWDADRVTVLATMEHDDLDAYPVLWVRTVGDGRVCYCSLGHTDEAFENESVRRILRNAVRWTAGT